MSIITRYVHWVGHDAGGTLPPLDVVAGIVRPGAWRLPQDWPPLTAGEALVFVPPQWIGDWETGHALAPAYHYLWRVSHAELRPLLNAAPLSVYLQPYRPPRLPISACNPSLSRQDWKRMARQNEVSEVPESSEFQ